MDVFKILTRGTKASRTNQKLGSEGGANRDKSLPSAGQNSTVQLFGQAKPTDSSNGTSTLGKRKREGAGANGLPVEIDFFQALSGVKKSRENEATPIRTSAPSESKLELVEADEDMDLNKCQARLRQHRIKISALRGLDLPRPVQNGSTKSKKKTRDAGESNISTSKNKKHAAVYTKPLSSFSQLVSRYDLWKKLWRNVDEMGYQEPTEIQLASLPILVGGDIITDDDRQQQFSKRDNVDLLAIAPTGSGKTLAFLIPAINSLLSSPDHSKGHGPAVLILAPTRELAGQIVGEGRRLVQGTRLKVSLIKKGMRAGEEVDLDDESSDQDASEDEQAVSTTVKSDIIVSTPMSLINALERNGEIRSSLPSIETLILDEADVLLDPLFKEQTLDIWKSCTNLKLRCSLWSATMPSNVESLALSLLISKIVLRLVVGLKDSALPTVKHQLTYTASEPGKLLALRQLLRPTASSSTTSPSDAPALRPPFLVFTQTIPRAVALHSELRYDIPAVAGGSARIGVLHSGMSETARAKVMAGFRRGEIWVIITTDLLARGVDFRGLNGVVNYDVPNSAASYVHRAGRTGRAGRKGGIVVTLFTKEDFAILRPVVNVISTSERLAGHEGEKSSIPSWLMDALPDMSKEERRRVKKRGMELRRPGVMGSRISTKAPEDYRKRQFKRREGRPLTKTNGHVQQEEDFEGFND